MRHNTAASPPSHPSMSSSARASRRRSDRRCSCRRPVRRVPPSGCLVSCHSRMCLFIGGVCRWFCRVPCSVAVHARSGALRHRAVGGHGRRVAGDRDGVGRPVGIRAPQPIGVSLHRADRRRVRTLHGAFHSGRRSIEDPAGGRGRGRGRGRRWHNRCERYVGASPRSAVVA